MVGANVEETIEVLAVIKRIVEENGFGSLIICGDINTDFRRNSGQVEVVNDFVEELRLKKVWDRYQVDFTRVSYDNEMGNIISSSVIDHFFYSEGLFDMVQDAGAIHSVDNRSDHSPVYTVLSSLNIKIDISDPVKPSPKPSWKKATQDRKISRITRRVWSTISV